MGRILASVALLAGLAVAPAHADPPPYNWTGFYVGLNAGSAAGNFSETQNLSAPNCAGPPGAFACPALIAFISTGHNLDPVGFTGCAQAGYNLQFNNLLVGLEADFEAFRVQQSFGFASGTLVPPDPSAASGSGSLSTTWLLTVRPRVGVVFDRFLVYATGGLGVTNVQFSESITATGNPARFPITGQYSVFTSSTKLGWAFGGGIEIAVWGTWSVKAEYLHLDFGDLNTVAPVFNAPAGGGLSNSTLSVASHLTADVVRAGINYKF